MPNNFAASLSVRPEIQRVLIYRLGSLGDTIVALPSLHLVARAFPQAERRMLTNFPINGKAPAAAAVLGESGLVHGYFRYAVGTRNPWELLKLALTLRRWRPDVLVYLAPKRGLAAARRDARFFRLCGIHSQIGVPLCVAMQENRFHPGDETFERECQRLGRNLAELGDAQIDKRSSWDLRLTLAEQSRAAAVVATAAGLPLLAISLGTKVQANDWGAENWRELLCRLSTRLPQHALLLLGVAEDRERSEFAAAAWRLADGAGPVLNLCGTLTPRESGACLADARLFVGHDSGPIHLAAASGVPCVGIYSARNSPGIWFPYGKQHRVLYHAVECRGCGFANCVVEKKRCLTSISVDEAEHAVLEALRESSGPTETGLELSCDDAR
jgi:ADP-heptose:LPS heptosyltransferase